MKEFIEVGKTVVKIYLVVFAMKATFIGATTLVDTMFKSEK